MKRWMLGSLLLGSIACGPIACGSTDPDPSSTADESTPIPDGFGKSDNYIATNASEWVLRGTASTSLPEDYETLEADAQDEAVQEAIAARTGEVTRAAKSHIEGILREENRRREAESPDSEPIEYFIYVKPSFSGGEIGDSEVTDGVATFDFTMELVGSLELATLVLGSDGAQSFDLQVGEETLSIILEASPSTDAFPKYNELFADGVYDIAIHFGGDYNEERYDLETAKWTVEYLLESGWQNPDVSTFDDLKHDSAPFSMTLPLQDGEIEARVYIYHAQMDDDVGAEQALLRELVELSVAERDVVIYSGHSGTNSGFILDYHPRYELDDADFDELPMSDDYQIFVFDGCNSYRTYVDALMENPAKTFDNTDLVTTVNTTPFSAGYEIINRFVHWLVLIGGDGTHFPVSWNTLLKGVNDQYPDVYYGVHGIDQDPKLNPHTGGGPMCQACSSDVDCGSGNFCMEYDGGSACGVACTDSSACGDGFECIAITDDPDQFYLPKQCVATSLACG